MTLSFVCLFCFVLFFSVVALVFCFYAVLPANTPGSRRPYWLTWATLEDLFSCFVLLLQEERLFLTFWILDFCNTDQGNHVVEDHPFSFFYFFLVLFWESELSGHMGRESHKWTKSTLLNSWILKPTPLFFNYLLTSKSIDTSIKFFFPRIPTLRLILEVN